MDLVNEASNNGLDDIIVIKTDNSEIDASIEAQLIKDHSSLSVTIKAPTDLETTLDNIKNPTRTSTQLSYVRFKTLYKRLSFFLLAIVVPIILLICIVLRPNFQSVIHLFLLFYLPFLYPINESSLSNRFKKYILCLIVVSCISLTGQLIFQIVVFSSKTDLLPNCSLKQDLFQEFGFAKFDKAYVGDIFRVLCPDVILLIGSLITYWINRKYSYCLVEHKRNLLYKYPNRSTKDTTFTDHFCPLKNVNENETVTPTTSRLTVESNKQSSHKHNTQTKIKRLYKIVLSYIIQILFMGLLFSNASIWPSVPTIPYFIAFLFLATKCSLTGRLKGTKSQYYTKIFFLFYTCLHILVIFLYQLDLFKQLIAPEVFLARLFGLNSIIERQCEQPSHIYLNPKLELTQIFQPFICILLYWLIALEFSHGLEKITQPTPQIVGFSPEINVDKPIESDHEKASDFDEINEKENGIFNEKNIINSGQINDQNSSMIDFEEKKLIDSEKKLFASDVTDSRNQTANLKLKKFSSPTYSIQSISDASSNLRKRKEKNKKRRQTAVIFDYTRAYLSSIFKFFNKQSYLLSLVSMMAWSILYHSILTLVLLLWACLIWTLPKTRLWCLRSSPLIITYAISLLILEFIYGLRLNSGELPEFKEIGLEKHELPIVHLAIKAGLTLIFWLTMHQFITERREATILHIPIYDTDTNQLPFLDQNFQTELFGWIQSIFAKYWIFLSSLMLLLMSCQNEVVAYRIGYMGLFLYFITTFQLLNTFWRMTLYIFNFIVIIYSMIVLVLIYIFQFDEVPVYFKRVLNINDEILSSIGFEKFDKKDQLVVRLLTPTTFLIVNIIQNHYFHDSWMKLTNSKRFNIESSEMTEPTNIINSDEIVVSQINCEDDIRKRKENFLSFLKRNMKKVNYWYSIISVYLWRLAEIHIYKVLICLIGIYCIKNVTIINFFLFVILLLSILISHSNQYDKKINSIFSGIVQIWVSLLTISSMFFQLKFVQSPIVTNCTFSNRSVSTIDPFLLKSQDNLKYIGIEKSANIQDNLKYCIIIFLLLTFQKIVKLKQKHYRLKKNISQPIYSIIFEHISWLDLDKDFLEFLKYMANYFFYRFGIEICLFMTSIVIITRMDAYAIVYGLWLGIFLNVRRTTIRKVWIYYFIFLIVLLPIQYAGCLGLPPVLCYEYPWSQWDRNQPNNIINKARIWMFLPDYSSPPSASKIIADFFQIFFTWLQLNVFNMEMDKNPKISANIIESMGGKNNELVYENKDISATNPFHDFISKTRNYLDKLKYGIYMYSYWVVLAIVFLSGTSRISILCMGYVILSFIFLWMGQTFLMRPLNKLLKFWNVLVSYCFLVIFIKAVLQIPICIFSAKIPSICLLIDIFGINCKALPSDKFWDADCLTNIDSGDVGLVWDIICFLVLLLQRRLYMSNMFEHVVNEYRAQAILAARGAEIFKKIIRHKVIKEKDKENKILEKLKANVERIREHQTDKSTKNPKDHYEAVRSGDYYMFDEEFEIDDSVDLNNQAMKTQDLDKEFLSSESSSNFSDEMKKTILSTAIILDNTENENGIENKKSWLTVENKRFLTIKYYVEKYFLIAFDLIIFYLNKQSKDFRLVSYMLVKEKLKLKFNTINQELSMHTKECSLNDQDIQQALKELNQQMSLQTRIDKFLSSIFYFALSQSEFICYFFMILNHLKSASLLSAPLPISIFLWAMLCLPRPTKTFWITSITYIETIVVIKYLFQFDFFSQDKESIKKVVQVLGIAKVNNFAVFDLFCLLVIFLHRTILKRLGLWKDYSSDEDDDEMITIKNEDKINQIVDENAQESSFGEKESRNLVITEIEKADSPDLEEDENANDSEDVENIEESGLKRLKYKAEQISKKKTTNPFLKFYRDIQSKHYAVVVDCYAKTFLCDFINCIITIFTYQYFGESAYLAAEDSSNSVVSSIKDNKVPYSFLVMFLIQFILMIVDRALYLRKNRVGKFLFQLALVLFVHVWVFFVLPYITKLPFVANRPVQIWYLVKCIYFGFSSRQIRCGYPTRILGNFLTKSYSYVNLVLFKGFLFVPFLLELRSLMDWMFTDTSLSLSDWLQMEDIYANIFVLKCFRYNENKHPTPRGTKRRAIIKYGFGGLLLTIIILIIWFPLLLFSVSKDFNESIPPQTCKVDLQIAGFLQIYSMSSQQRLAQKFSQKDFDTLKNIDSGSYSFLKDYTPDDVYCISIPGNSTSIWQISPPSFENLKEQLKEPDPVELNFFYSITRVSTGLKNEQISEIVSASKQSKLFNETKLELYQILNNEYSSASVKLESVYPRFVHARTKGNIVEIDSMKNSEKLKYYVDIQIQLRNQSNNLWWDAFEIPTKNYTPPCSKPGFLSVVVVSDQVSPSSISFITEQGIVGLYSTFIILIAQLVKDVLVGSSTKIIYQELPNVDKILQLLNDILLVRSLVLLDLEDELYEKLIYIYRDPAFMIHITRCIYITFVLALSRFIRIMVVNSSMKIMFDQLPNVDRILKLVRSVYMVRENKQFLLEEELYAKIIFLYRSPETMIKYTRPKKRPRNEKNGNDEAIDDNDKKNQ